MLSYSCCYLTSKDLRSYVKPSMSFFPASTFSYCSVIFDFISERSFSYSSSFILSPYNYWPYSDIFDEFASASFLRFSAFSLSYVFSSWFSSSFFLRSAKLFSVLLKLPRSLATSFMSSPTLGESGSSPPYSKNLAAVSAVWNYS